MSITVATITRIDYCGDKIPNYHNWYGTWPFIYTIKVDLVQREVYPIIVNSWLNDHDSPTWNKPILSQFNSRYWPNVKYMAWSIVLIQHHDSQWLHGVPPKMSHVNQFFIKHVCCEPHRNLQNLAVSKHWNLIHLYPKIYISFMFLSSIVFPSWHHHFPPEKIMENPETPGISVACTECTCPRKKR